MARISLKQWCAEQGIGVTLNEKGAVKLDDSPQLIAALEPYVIDSVVPALCDEGCEVEPDGRCSHGAPSILIACGLA
jgi:hypothetical protein